MNTPEKYLDVVHWFTPDAPRCEETARAVHQWVRAQAAHVRTLCPPKRLRCFALVTSRRIDPQMISVEFAAPDDSYYAITIHCSGPHDVRGDLPRTISLGAGIKLLALLADELKVAVTLQP